MTKNYLSLTDAFTKQLFPEQRQPTGKDEWYTPPPIIEAARNLMGSIDLDPASCEAANTVVQAKQYFGINDDALQQHWGGNLWLNPPYGARLLRAFHKKLCESPAVTKACFLSPMVSGRHCLTLLAEAPAVAFLDWRVKGWWGPATEGKTQPMGWGLMQVACYGVTIEETRQAFRHLGVVR